MNLDGIDVCIDRLLDFDPTTWSRTWPTSGASAHRRPPEALTMPQRALEALYPAFTPTC